MGCNLLGFSPDVGADEFFLGGRGRRVSVKVVGLAQSHADRQLHHFQVKVGFVGVGHRYSQLPCSNITVLILPSFVSKITRVFPKV